MSGKVLYLPSAERVDFCVPSDVLDVETLIPIVIDDDAQAGVEIYKQDIVVVDTSRRPEEGQYSAVLTLQGFILGHLTHHDGRIYLKLVCECAGCEILKFSPQSVLSYGPVVSVCRRGGQGCHTVCLNQS